MTSFRSLLRAMWLGFKRDRAALFFTIAFPLMFLVIFGSIFRNPSVAKSKIVEVAPVQLVDSALAGSADLRGVVTVSTATTEAAALDKVAKGDVDAYVRQDGDTLIVRYSAAESVNSGVVRGILEQIVQGANLQAAGGTPRYAVEATPVEDASLAPIQYLTPGLLGWAIASAGVFGASQTLVQWRTKGLLRRLRLSPAEIRTLFGARITLGAGIGLGQVALFLAVATIPLFGLKLRGSWWLSIPMMLVGTLAFLAIGVLIGGRAKTQESAQAVTQMVVMPMAFLGGSFFPLDQAPTWMRVVSRIFPLRYLNDGMLNVIGRDRGWDGVAVPMLVLGVFAVVVALIARATFRWDS